MNGRVFDSNRGDEVWKKLRTNLEDEFHANNNVYDKDTETFPTFDFFASLCNITIIPNEPMEYTDRQEEIDKLLATAKGSLDFESIDDIRETMSTEQIELLIQKVYDTSGTTEDRLRITKYMFVRYFRKDTPLDGLKALWEFDDKFPERVAASFMTQTFINPTSGIWLTGYSSKME